MRTFSRIGLVPVAVMLAAGAAPASHAQPDHPGHPSPEPVDAAALPLRDLRTDREITLESIRGSMVALHFLGGGDRAGHIDFMREFLESAPAVAGVRHLFIDVGRAGTRDWRADLEAIGLDAEVYEDRDAALRRALEVDGVARSASESAPTLDPDTLPPALVVLDADGAELFRVVGADPHDHIEFPAFADRVREATRTPSIEHYNLPRRTRGADAPLAVEGYDLVSYFTASRPVRGLERYSSEYRGVEYRFSSDDNRRLFAASPGKYLPTYGGWCASAMGDGGRKVEVSPTNFQVRGGRLHLFYKDFFSDALSDWKRHPEWESQADDHWRRIAAEEPRLPNE